MSLEPGEIIVRGDERKLRQVVFNLLSNAVNFTPAGGRVSLSASMPNGVVEVAVSDTGPGIALEDQDVIFEEFRQARGDADRRDEGTGLGLPLSRRLIELHGGRLWVESAVGKGTTFRFTLPAEST
jgi:signal transduction histidine kinase